MSAPNGSPAKRPEDRGCRRCGTYVFEDLHVARFRHADLARAAARRRRRNILSALLGLTACPTFIAGLYAVQDQGDARYGAVGAVLSVALVMASERAGRWLP